MKYNSLLSISLVILFLISIFSVIISNDEPLEANLNSISNDTIQYTDNHTILEIGPSSRKAILELPGGHNVSHKLPLVVALHGYTSSGLGVSGFFDLIDSVHENGHLLLRPDGTISATGQRFWNATDACCNIWGQEVDDVSWLTSLINEAITYHGADPEGIIIVGYSNGGFMAHRMACERGDMLRSIISLAGATHYDFNDCPNTGYPNVLQIHGTSDSVIFYDGGAILGDNYPAASQTVFSWANRSGCDLTYTEINQLDLISPRGVNDTNEYEHLNCSSGNRVSLWEIPNGSHYPQLSSSSDDDFPSTILDWGLTGYFPDSDADGVRDNLDAFPNNPLETSDSDGDGVGDNTDQFPLNPNEIIDSDGDGVGDNSDIFPENPHEQIDSDGDGVGDNSDIFPNDSTEWQDTDSDGIGDNSDVFPNDSTEWLDTDRDGVGDNADQFPLNPNEIIDSDGDGVGDNSDIFPENPHEQIDSDGDGVGDNSDVFPHDSNETLDSDADGSGDNSDIFPYNPYEQIDSDADGVGDNSDVFPYNPNETLDSDADGVGDNSDVFPYNSNETLDSDGDGIGDNSDIFPNDSTEWLDSDADGIGDNSDVFPFDSSEYLDFDNDGIGDNSDIFPDDPNEHVDSDGDGVGDNSDAFPNDSSEDSDTDGDGVGDNSDFYPGDSTRSIEEKSNPLNIIFILLFLSLILYITTNSPSNNNLSNDLLFTEEE
ncbi:MAG: thrombospondin type 3 repeat-containing protein [Candidatus Thalassarchaeaceae archaeon]